ncbi:CCA tRNA nucleotidyltransferase 1, mitochondrial [Armadillidium nasatum]|uniref:CCA tRNA nucleotidyltransferase 1, mitochondrial n=1 Tax=Armadillidium nasatum TaxID=96803 RepID=A0A5N5TNH3_9CRUS|nr:CCA tRNA nucleotidyltransferase 1, mitochondrial [Armadillidium nasatum]
MRISAEKMKFVLRPSVQTLQNIFAKYNYEIRVAGGAVRDLLMDRIPTDLDFATTATPNEMKKMFTTEEIRMININGEKHGTITARIEEDNFECSTLRVDKIIDGGRKEIEFIRDWKQDANRRDLTVNAMFLGLDGTVYDFFNGIQHLKERIVKFVENPDARIQEDPLRIIRYFRFFGALANDPYTHDPEAIASIIRNGEGLSRVSGERIITEFRKILTGRYNFEMLSKMIECKLGGHIGLSRDFDCENLSKIYKYIKDTDYHYCLLLAAGMTDVEEATTFINRVKGTNKEKEMLLFIIKYRQSYYNIQSLKEVRDLLVDFVYKEKKGHSLALDLSKQLLLYVGRKDLLNEVNENLIPYFPIRGGLLVDKVENKKFIQRELNKLLDLWKESDYMLSRDELLNKV